MDSNAPRSTTEDSLTHFADDATLARITELEAQLSNGAVSEKWSAYSHSALAEMLEDREAQLAAMTAERDHAEITTDAYIDELREQLAATIKERDELRARDQRFSMREPTALRYQLAASQAREKVLRAALKKLHDCFDPDDWAGDESMLGVSGKALTLTIPTDDSALRQYVARELQAMRDKAADYDGGWDKMLRVRIEELERG